MPGGGRVAAVHIDLAELLRDRQEPRGVGRAAQRVGAHPGDFRVEAIRDRHETTRIAVGCRAEDQPILGEPDAPGVVVGGADEQLRMSRRKKKMEGISQVGFYIL